MKRFALAAAVLTLVSTSAFATDALKIEGDVIQNVTADRNVNTALGQDSVARQLFGVVDANVSGTVEQNVNAFENTNTAEGQRSEACQTFGTIGSPDHACD
jgi:hypothetical protein